MIASLQKIPKLKVEHKSDVANEYLLLGDYLCLKLKYI